MFRPWQTFQSIVDGLDEDRAKNKTSFRTISYDGFTHYVIQRGKFAYLFARIVIPKHYWLFEYINYRWSYTMNKFLAEALDLSKEEVLLTRFSPVFKNQINFYFDSTIDLEPAQPHLSLSGFAIKAHEFVQHQPLELWFYNKAATSPHQYVFTDLLFLEFSAQDEVKIDSLVLKASIRFGPPKYQYNNPGCYSEAVFLSGTQAIHLVTTKQSVVYALPWRAAFQTREEVMDYCRDVFNWFEDRASGAADACPGQVLASIPNQSWLLTSIESLHVDFDPTVHFLGSPLTPNRWEELGDFFN